MTEKQNSVNIEDTNKGKPAFIIGAGPSLHFQDISPLKNYITIAVNSAILKVDFCNYFCSDDWAITCWNYWKDIQKSSCIKLLYREKLSKYSNFLKRQETFWYNHKIWYNHVKKLYNPEGLVFTKNQNDPIIGARTSMGSAVHLAYIMGCDPIVLLGSDCCLYMGKRYFWQFDGEKPCINHCRNMLPPSRILKGNGDYQQDDHSVDFIRYWDALSKQALSQNVNIINASGGILQSFPKMTLEQVLEKYG